MAGEAVGAIASWWGSLATGTQTVIGGAAASAAGAGVAAALQPKVPGAKPVTPMPDQQTLQQNAARQALIDQSQRRGRASTILSDPSGDSLG